MTIKAAGIADQVATVTISIDSATGGVFIQWIAPHDGSEALTEYLIEIRNVGEVNFFEDDDNCDGDDPSVTQCLIPMDTLTLSPFNLGFNNLVVARVTAINSYGSSVPSELNTDGARIRRKPSKIASVNVVSFTDTTADLSW